MFPAQGSYSQLLAACPNLTPPCILAGAKTVTGVRLVGGRTPKEGRLELQLLGGEWSAVQGVGALSPGVAKVACRQLGYSGGDIRSGQFDGVDFPPTAIDNLECEGSEGTLNACSWAYYPTASPAAFGVACS